MTGAPLALVVDYGTHADTTYRSVTMDGGFEVSGDVPGFPGMFCQVEPDFYEVVGCVGRNEEMRHALWARAWRRSARASMRRSPGCLRRVRSGPCCGQDVRQGRRVVHRAGPAR